MMLKKTLLVALMAVVAVLQNGQADAGIVSYSATVSPQPTSFEEMVSLQKFDSSLGTLTGVTVSFSADVNVVVSVANFTGKSQGFTNAQAAVPFSVIAPDGSSVSGTATAFFGSGTVASGIGPYNFPGTPTHTTGQYTVASSNWSDFIGTGVAYADFKFVGSEGTFNGTAANGVYFGGNAIASGEITITYEYTSVPEPSTFALGATGLAAAGFGFARRRRQTQAV
ncbi:choice-of-anchor E domain-containing protein [Schlesneria sp. T3-172]|uniref:choice-of-anchor E domain-containing protein n=1 Tax=Schlesneria TaxID=656899 RepID=UPI002F0E2F22